MSSCDDWPMPPTPSPTPVLPGAPTWLTPTLFGPLLSTTMACLALIFTLSSFWWLNARRGKVRSFAPSSFAASFSARRLVLIFPLVLLNDGAAPVVVADLRVRLAQPTKRIWRDSASMRAGRRRQKRQELTLRLRGTHNVLPDSLTAPVLPAVFAVSGRKTESLILEFGLKDPVVVPSKGTYRAYIEGRMLHQRGFRRRRWKGIVAFDLQVDQIGTEGQYTAISSDPDWVP
jgi:hypothetical protein